MNLNDNIILLTWGASGIGSPAQLMHINAMHYWGVAISRLGCPGTGEEMKNERLKLCVLRTLM
jgi:hypothetical protein